jgi:hypothetical protein
VLETKSFLQDGERPLQGRLGLGVLALVPVEQRQIVQVSGYA